MNASVMGCVSERESPPINHHPLNTQHKNTTTTTTTTTHLVLPPVLLQRVDQGPQVLAAPVLEPLVPQPLPLPLRGFGVGLGVWDSDSDAKALKQIPEFGWLGKVCNGDVWENGEHTHNKAHPKPIDRRNAKARRTRGKAATQQPYLLLGRQLEVAVVDLLLQLVRHLLGALPCIVNIGGERGRGRYSYGFMGGGCR